MFHLAMLIASDTTFTDLLKYISQGGVLGLLFFILVGGYRQWWVFGWQYKESEERIEKTERERDDWRDIALHGTNLAEQTVGLFKRSRGS